ncbi:sigma-70 family RNA polymerase sigma factor [Amycolatopsis sp., V23-08]|uniref:Sigma-70 family RNA polymerase sigma factor n=1 Tax=Amycolatopsis heterodermiae TaxID=3110235 RepID=A0ABU5R4B1_9PSEU|nr:sigma-70 family RNA polymerase sigma factor [Amycolatopsis sp., V23-08]MEA5360534.1 sigma-70 family RNA polymerase sigma factor [Amycolatopsis sp., V23-08]
MYHDSPAPLLENAARGAEWAWRDIVVRYSSLVSAVCRQYRISGADAEDVAGAVWLNLVTHLAHIRDAEALPGWLSTTTRHECLRLLRHRNRQVPTDAALIDDPAEPDFDAALVAGERRAAARHAFAQLPPRDQRLLAMLLCDPPRSYREISATLGIPVGSIGPSRARCLARARRAPAVAALLGGDPHDVPGHTPQSARATA